MTQIKINKLKILHVSDRKQWCAWLKQNFNKQREIWLASPNKSSGKQRLLYNDAVEEALCFGWIDSTVRKLDKAHSIQRFTPRNPKSNYSQPNKERLKRLAKAELLQPSVQSAVKDILKEKYVFPADILRLIKQDKIAWKNYSKFTAPYKRIRIAYIDGARQRPEEFKKRLRNFIKKTKANKQMGFGGIEKYY